ncbi:hypothetical protein CR203_20785 [Salipaludibacillus neizhouensis]|uniref:Uncharacterized protein n=1 Tax=Salipaludibacillus neizhouensis TaxID=885475 RepID=A0A3A9JY33_9BACI|nr:hypothetical protein [Salipaludibacillus neizhouensis]RKL65387.1 hypothetical protein CR203_20785 [Salipaludibacillus neizhouensis]
MAQYTGFVITLGFIFIIVIFNKYMFWWGKSVIITYYLVVSYFFITVKNRIDEKYEDILPVPEEYWDQNTGWVGTITNYLFLPLIGIIVFIYFRWFTKARTKKGKVLILLSVIPATVVYVLFSFLFSFVYGYRP